MGKFVLFLFERAGALASIAALYLTVVPLSQARPLWHWLVLGVVFICFVYFVAKDTIRYLKPTRKSYNSQNKINDYMFRWISSGGRTVIFSRNMSWVTEPRIWDLLMRKAREGELTLCVEAHIRVSDELRAAGARVVTYSELGHVPKSRFTIIDYEKDGARVAIGQKIGGTHIIEEFEGRTHPLFSVAEDLVKLLCAYDERKSGNSGRQT
jgi:hypothetical protein